MTPETTSQITAGLLLLSLASVFLIAMTLTFFAVRYVRGNRLAGHPRRTEQEEERSHQPVFFHSTAFETNCRWLAIRSSNLSAVQNALRVQNPTPCSWTEGLSRLVTRSLFISPPVQGWILVIGHGLPDPGEDVDQCFFFVTRLSRALGHVQFFSSNRAVNHHAWVRVEDGRVRRAYVWAGETLWNQGHMTEAEGELGLRCYNYGEAPCFGGFSAGEAHHANADKILFLAARWSLDPTSINAGALGGGQGILADLFHTKLH
jgi:hypothetical protein